MNMSYCKWENTARDLEQCLDDFDGVDSFNDLSRDEKKGCKRVLQMIADWGTQAEEMLQEIEEDES